MILYKYLTEERIDVLSNSAIRYTQPSSFNDPFETVPFIEALVPPDGIEQIESNLFCQENIDNVDLDKVIESLLANETLPAEFAGLAKSLKKEDIFEMIRPLVGTLLKEFLVLGNRNSQEDAQRIICESLDSKFGVLCLTEKNDNHLMWSHYANSHKGFVIGFDTDNACFDKRSNDTAQIGFIKKVEYSVERPRITFYQPGVPEDLQAQNIAKDFFYKKSKCWEYEQEWRILREFTDADKVINIANTDEKCYLFMFPPAAIHCLVVGSKMTKVRKNFIIDTLNSDSRFNHIKLFQSTVDKVEYQLNITPIERVTVE